MKTTKRWWSAMRTESREGRSSRTPFILLPSSLLLTAPPLLAPRWVAKLFRLWRKVLYAPQLPRRSSSRVGAVLRDEREGEERGKSEHFLFYIHVSPLCLVSPTTKSFRMEWFSNETIKNIVLFIILKIENWPIKRCPEQGGANRNWLSSLTERNNKLIRGKYQKCPRFWKYR